MRIPVWVSRDIVVDEVEDLNNSVESISVIGGNSSTTHSNNTSRTSSAESILQDLNKQEKVPFINRDVIKQPVTQKESVPSTLNPQQKTTNEIARTVSHIVFGSGHLQADWMVIGESPEINDTRQNQPYPGELGVLLCNMLRAVGIENPRENAYMINVIKSSMQAIEPSSIGELNKVLNDKISAIKPKIVIVVGQLAAQNLLQSKEPLARLRAKSQFHPQSNTNIIVTYYPSYLLSKPTDKRKAWEDLKLAMSLVESSKTASE